MATSGTAAVKSISGLLPVHRQFISGLGASLSGKEGHLKRIRSLHINHLELLAVKLALQHFKEGVQARTVLLCDNSMAVAYLRRREGLNPGISAFSRGRS